MRRWLLVVRRRRADTLPRQVRQLREHAVLGLAHEVVVAAQGAVILTCSNQRARLTLVLAVKPLVFYINRFIFIFHSFNIDDQ